jgi:transcriptional regulator with XRE-family HTH domain
MPNGPAVGFAGLLRRLRVRAKLTQEELATAARVSGRTISDLERGINRTARRDTAELLADALGLAGPQREEFLAAARGKPTAAERAAQARAAEAGGPADDADASNWVWIESAASPNFVNRERELGALREAWSAARAGRRVLALVAGDPGIGKSALSAELARHARAGGGLVLYGRWDEGVPAPYRAFREALADYARACPEAVLRADLGDLAAEIARLFPEHAQRIGASAAPPLTAAEAERFRLFESLDTWLQRMGARHPVLLVLDDLQWADRPSLHLLSHLMQARRSSPLLAVAMYRDRELEGSALQDALPSLARDIDCRPVMLAGLGHDAVTALLEAAAGRRLAESEWPMVTELERETAGNPFFLLEMARHLSERGALRREAAGLGQAPADIPESVRGLVRSRLGRLSGGCAEVIAIASVIGERFDTDLVASVASLEDAATVDLLDEAARAGLITEVDDEPDLWLFWHSLTRRVIAEELSRNRRARLHQRIGEILQSRPGASPAELAHHFGAAASRGSAAKAVRYERLAGARAMAEVAAEVAVPHFRKALDLLDRYGPQDLSAPQDPSAPQDQSLRCELLLELAGAHDRAGEYAARDERFTEAADAARRLGNDELFLRAALGYGGVLPAAVSPDRRAQALLAEALEQAGELGGQASRARAMILARLAHWLNAERPYAERLQISDRSVAMARGLADRRTLATVLLHRCWALDGPGDVDDAAGVAREVLGISDELGDPELRLEGLRIRLSAQFEKGEHLASVATARELADLAAHARHPEFIRLAAMWDITVANSEGRFADADLLGDDLIRQLRRIGHPQAEVIPVTQAFPQGVLRGHAAEYVPLFEALSAEQPANMALPAITAWCLAEAGQRDRAAGLLRRLEPAAAQEADENYLWWAVIVGFASAADLTADRQWARVLYDLAAPYAGHNATLGVASFLGAADHWLGVLAGAAGRPGQAIAHLEAALTRHRDMGSRPLRALSEEACAHVLSVRGHPGDLERARQLTESAMRTAGELGLTAISDRHRLRA